MMIATLSFVVLYLMKRVEKPNVKYPVIKNIEKQYNYYGKNK